MILSDEELAADGNFFLNWHSRFYLILKSTEEFMEASAIMCLFIASKVMNQCIPEYSSIEFLISLNMLLPDFRYYSAESQLTCTNFQLFIAFAATGKMVLEDFGDIKENKAFTGIAQSH